MKKTKPSSFYFGLSILILTLSLLGTGIAQAQNDRLTLVGTWEGSTAIGNDAITLAFTFAIENGEYTATLTNSSKGVYGMPVASLSVNGLNLVARLPEIDVEFLGRLRLNDAGDTILRIDGDWYQLSEMTPVVLLPLTQ